MKKSAVMLLIIALISILCCVCSAESAQDLIKREEENSREELRRIQQLIDSNSEFFSSMMLSLNPSVDKNEIISSIKTDNAYKKYRLNTSYIADDYKKNGSFASLIDSNYSWIIPLYKENIYISFGSNGDGWEFGSSGNSPVYTDDDGNKLDLDFSLKGITEKLNKEKNITDIEQIKYVTADKFDFVYVLAGGTEYLIPYTSRPDFTDLENGKIYTAREALKIYAKDYPVQIVHLMPWEKDPKLNGGAYRIVYNYTPFYIGGAVLLLIAAGIVILIIRKKRTI